MGVGIFWICLNWADLSCWRLTLSENLGISLVSPKVQKLQDTDKTKELGSLPPVYITTLR